MVVHTLPGTQTATGPAAQPWRALPAVSVAAALIILNSSSMNVALPVVVRDLDAGPFAASWLLLSYGLAQVSLLVLAGRIADVLGRRRVYLTGLAAFAAASLLAGLAPSVHVLIAARLLQGATSAMILANGVAAITEFFTGQRLQRALGLHQGVLASVGMAGPALGGLLAQHHWRWVFWINVPIALAILAWTAATMPRHPACSSDPLDWPGALLLAGWTAPLMLALTTTGEHGPTLQALGWAAAALTAAPMFLLRQRRARHPLIKPSVLTDRNFTTASLAALLIAPAKWGAALLIVLYLQTAGTMTPAQAGLASLPVPIASLLASPLAGIASARWGPRTVAVAGAVTTAYGMAITAAVIGPATPYPALAAGLAIAAAGAALFTTANMTLIMAGTGREQPGALNGARLTTLNLGTALSAAIFLPLVGAALPATARHLVFQDAAHIPAALTPTLIGGYRLTFALLAATALLACLPHPLRRTPLTA